MSMNDALAVNDMTEGLVRGVPGFDPDDMFGVRRALRTLPEHLWDDFFSTWGKFADAADLDLVRMQASAAREATVAAGCDTGDGGLANAWQTVADAMNSYLDWKARPHAL